MKTLHKGVPKYQYYDISGYFTVHYQYAGGKYFFFLKKAYTVMNKFCHKDVLQFFTPPQDGDRDPCERAQAQKSKQTRLIMPA